MRLRNFSLEAEEKLGLKQFLIPPVLPSATVGVLGRLTDILQEDKKSMVVSPSYEKTLRHLIPFCNNIRLQNAVLGEDVFELKSDVGLTTNEYSFTINEFRTDIWEGHCSREVPSVPAPQY